jgi:hypothetical protein
LGLGAGQPSDPRASSSLKVAPLGSYAGQFGGPDASTSTCGVPTTPRPLMTVGSHQTAVLGGVFDNPFFFVHCDLGILYGDGFFLGASGGLGLFKGGHPHL